MMRTAHRRRIDEPVGLIAVAGVSNGLVGFGAHEFTTGGGSVDLQLRLWLLLGLRCRQEIEEIVDFDEVRREQRISIARRIRRGSRFHLILKSLTREHRLRILYAAGENEIVDSVRVQFVLIVWRQNRRRPELINNRFDERQFSYGAPEAAKNGVTPSFASLIRRAGDAVGTRSDEQCSGGVLEMQRGKQCRTERQMIGTEKEMQRVVADVERCENRIDTRETIDRAR